MTTHDALLAAIAANPGDSTPKLALADWLDENGHHGGQMLRAAGQLQQFWGDRVDGMLGQVHPPANRLILRHPETAGRVRHYIEPHYATTGGEPARQFLQVVHFPDAEGPVNPGGPRGVAYTVPVYSKQHLQRLTADWPENDKRDWMLRRLELLLPDTHPEDVDRYAAAITSANRQS